MSPVDKPRPQPCTQLVGDSALLIEFEDRIDPVVNAQVLALKLKLNQSRDSSVSAGITEMVAAYRSLLVYYDCRILSVTALRDAVENACARPGPGSDSDASNGYDTQRRWRVPVCYGGSAGADLDELARIHDLTTADVIKLHSDASYHVYMLGFAPGWCYLGGLTEKLHTPRLESPRLEVPPGCISIGGQQALIGAQAMPSGWRLLGQTPVRNYDPARNPEFLFTAGDAIEFYSIDASEFQKLEKAAARGEIVAEALSK